jgi:hypothetical protein
MKFRTITFAVALCTLFAIQAEARTLYVNASRPNNKGKLTKTQKKLVGSKDLAGRKRIRGKAIDRGCYEY